MRDALTDALNAPSGHLAEILIKRMAKSEGDRSMTPEMQERFDKLASAPGTFGKLARVRFAAEVSRLFERAPIWTSERIVPLFNWSMPEASDVWNARKYSNYIGSPKLFELTKKPFLELFSRPGVAEDDLRVFAEWLVIILVANQASDAGYPISSTEARSALRSAGVRALPTVAHRLAVEMAGANSGEKKSRWRQVVGPVFQSIWPLDAEIQSEAATYPLVHILRSSGDAFPEAADAIIPFIQAEDPRRQTSMYSISTADEQLYRLSPSKMLELISAVVGEAPARSIYGLMKALDMIKKHAPKLAETKKFQRLEQLASLH